MMAKGGGPDPVPGKEFPPTRLILAAS